ncbi:hypothetical protein ACTXT7_007748 [Hymenolepis weldensis]
MARRISRTKPYERKIKKKENSKNFDEVALNFLIRALCCLATESSEVANSSRKHGNLLRYIVVGNSDETFRCTWHWMETFFNTIIAVTIYLSLSDKTITRRLFM